MNEDVPAAAHNAAQIAVISAVILVGIVILSTIYFFITSRQTATLPPTPSPTPTVEVSQTLPSPTQVAMPSISPSGTLNVQKFISSEKNISFSFNPVLGEDPADQSNKIMTQETGNKIILYPQLFGPEGGQSVEVFKKESSESIETAIKRMFLAGKDPTRCLISTRAAKMNNSYVEAEITYPENQKDDLEKLSASAAYCSPEYGQTNGLRYFLYDPSHPTTLLFFNIGQYAILSGDTPWQDTFEFIN